MRTQPGADVEEGSWYSIREICEIVGISRNTYYKYTRMADQLLPPKQRTKESKGDQPAAQDR